MTMDQLHINGGILISTETDCAVTSRLLWTPVFVWIIYGNRTLLVRLCLTYGISPLNCAEVNLWPWPRLWNCKHYQVKEQFASYSMNHGCSPWRSKCGAYPSGYSWCRFLWTNMRASGCCNSASRLKKGNATLAVATNQALAKGARRKGATMGTCARSHPGHHQPMKGGARILGLAVATH